MFLTYKFDNEKLFFRIAGVSHFTHAATVFYLTTRITTSLGLFRVTAGRSAIAAIPFCRKSRSTPFSSMYRS